MTSYEGLADAAYSAAMNIERYIRNSETGLDKLDNFSRMLSEPLESNNSYKLLHDARILPLYRIAWSEFKGSQIAKKNTDTLLAEISTFINSAKVDIESKNTVSHAKQVARFCLLLNKIFLEKNAENYETSYRSRVSNGSAGVDRF